MAPNGIVTLTTDFGLDDSYVAELHAVLLASTPRLTVVDLSHSVPPGDLDSTLYLTERAWPAFPIGTVHMVVVDPGVGGARRLVAVESAGSFYVGPDTGVLSSALPEIMRSREGPSRGALPAAVRAVEISGSPSRQQPVSTTFQGRDVMAPVAAAIATGSALEETGETLTELRLAPPIQAVVRDGLGKGRIIHIDHFGNSVTNFRTRDAGPAFRIEVGNIHALGPAASYLAGTPDTPVAIGGSGGYIEVAWPGGDAAGRLGLRRGDPARIRPA